MAIETDFTVYPDSKVIRHTGANDDVWEVAAFYSWLQNLFDEPGFMSYEKPIRYNTPESFTMLNGWFLDNGAAGTSDTGYILKYLSGGTIDTLGYDTVSDPIYMMDIDTQVAAFVAADKDKRVRTNDADDVGPLLAFISSYPVANSARCWFRDVNSIGAPGSGEDVDMTLDTGTGDYTNTGGSAAANGDEIYANIFTLAAYAGSPNPQVYIKQTHPIVAQGDIRISEWSNTDSWDRGSTATEEIDVLLPVVLGGTAIDSGNLEVFARQTGDTFTHSLQNVSTTAGSRTPVALETNTDTVNITKGEYYLLYDTSDTDSFEAGDVIQDVSTANTSPPSWYAEVVAVTEFTSTTEGVLTLRGLNGSITDSDPIWVETTQEAAALGTEGGTYFTASAVGTQLTVGLTVTGGNSGAKRVIRGVNNVASDYHYVAQVDEAITGSAKDAYYKDFTTGETITDSGSGTVTHEAASSVSIISDYTDVVIAHVNGTVTVGTSWSGEFEKGETMSYNGGADTCVLLYADSYTAAATMTIGNVGTTEPDASDDFTGLSSGATVEVNSVMTDANTQNYEFPLQATTAVYSIFIQGGDIFSAGRTLEDIYAYLQYKVRDGETDVIYTSDGSSITQIQGQFYIKGATAYSGAWKQYPYGQLAGGVFFGAQGVWIEGIDSSDDNSLKLTDHAGDAQEPDISVNVTIGNTRVSDVITVFLEDGSTGLPDKAQFTCIAGELEGEELLNKTAATDFPNDTPLTNGSVYVVATDENEEHRYRYASWSGEVITLATKVDGTADTGTTGQTLKDPGIFTSGVERGDIIHRTSGSNEWCYVISKDDNDTVTTTVLSDGTDWAVGNVFEVNSLVQNYDTGDTFFIPYLDAIEDDGSDGSPGSEVQSLTYVSNRSVVIAIRNVLNATPIQPFDTTSDITTSGMTVSVIRNEDTVYS